MKRMLPEPERWCDRPARATSAENAFGAAFRRLKQATEPSEAALTRLTADARTHARGGDRRVWRWRVALAAALLIAMGGAVGAARSNWWRPSAPAPLPPAGDGARPQRLESARPGQRHRAAAPPVAALSPAPEGHPPPSEAPAAVRMNLPVPRPPGHAPASPPATEAGLLAAAFRQLRSAGDASTALRSLDEYDRRFPAGLLRAEAKIARAEALIALGRRSEAVPVLSGIEDSGGALSRPVRITRAELLAENGRCVEALADFDGLLSSAAPDGVTGRALFGRASCRLRGREETAARRDLERYLSLFPDGELAAAARTALGAPP
jgi:hypothetical protein